VKKEAGTLTLKGKGELLGKGGWLKRSSRWPETVTVNQLRSKEDRKNENTKENLPLVPPGRKSPTEEE